MLPKSPGVYQWSQPASLWDGRHEKENHAYSRIPTIPTYNFESFDAQETQEAGTEIGVFGLSFFSFLRFLSPFSFKANISFIGGGSAMVA